MEFKTNLKTKFRKLTHASLRQVDIHILIMLLNYLKFIMTQEQISTGNRCFGDFA